MVHDPGVFYKAATQLASRLRPTLLVLLYLISRFTFRGKEVFILIYHSIGSSELPYTVAPRQFYSQMEYLRRNHNVVSLSDIVAFAEGEKDVPRRSVAVTFDDGFHDNYLNALPYFRKHGLPAAIFVTTGYCNREIVLKHVAIKMLSWDEVREISRSNIIIGAHTVSHPDLRKVSLEDAKDEILRSRIEIERQIGKRVEYFAYPFSVCSPEIVCLVRSSGYLGAVCGIGSVEHGANPFILGRIEIDRGDPLVIFKARLSRATEWCKKIERMANKLLNVSPF